MDDSPGFDWVVQKVTEPACQLCVSQSHASYEGEWQRWHRIIMSKCTPASMDKLSSDTKPLRGRGHSFIRFKSNYIINRFLGGGFGWIGERQDCGNELRKAYIYIHKRVILQGLSSKQVTDLGARTKNPLAGSQTFTRLPQGTSALGFQNIPEIHVTTCV